MMLRAGPYDLTLADLEAAPHGDRPRRAASRGCPRCCARRAGRSSSRREPIVADVPRLRDGAGRARQRRHGARRPPRPALEQLVDAQPAAAGQRTGALHGVGASGRRRAPRAGRRRARARQLARGRDRAAGRGDRGRHARRRLDPARLGPRRAGARSSASRPSTRASNSNVLADELLLDPVSGNAVLNGIPVEVAPVRQPAAIPVVIAATERNAPGSGAFASRGMKSPMKIFSRWQPRSFALAAVLAAATAAPASAVWRDADPPRTRSPTPPASTRPRSSRTPSPITGPRSRPCRSAASSTAARRTSAGAGPPTATSWTQRQPAGLDRAEPQPERRSSSARATRPSPTARRTTRG